MKYILLLLLFSFTSISIMAQTQEVPYTLDDRDRVIRVEAKMEVLETKMEVLDIKMESLETKMDIKFDSQQRQLNDIKTLFYWGFGILITLFVFMFGYMIWDRRTAMKPALDKAEVAEDKSKSLIFVLREYARKKPELAEIMKVHGLL